MPECPYCHQSVESQAIACPFCRRELKAFGHPGIPLHRASQEDFLCTSCLYDKDDTCNFPQRPYAKSCTLYHDHTQPIIASAPVAGVSSSFLQQMMSWMKRNVALLVLVGLGLVSLFIALNR